MNQSGGRGQMCQANPVDIGRRSYSRNLRSLICPNLALAATHLFHVAALPVHCAAASAFFMAHHHTRQAGHNGRGCSEQKDDCDDAGKTAHHSIQYTSGWLEILDSLRCSLVDYRHGGF